MHDRPRLTRSRRTLALSLTVVLIAVGAGLALVIRHLDRPVQVTAPPGAADPACTALTAALPSRLLGHDRVATSTDSPAVAAWGQPAIIWRCGVASLGPTTRECIGVNGVDWVWQSLDDGASFTTYGRDPAVQVLVPATYAPETFALPALSTVVATLPQGEHHCT